MLKERAPPSEQRWSSTLLGLFMTPKTSNDWSSHSGDLNTSNNEPHAPLTPELSAAIITVVRDPKNTLGKTFDIQSDGTVSKKSAVSISLGIAVMHRVETQDELAGLLSVSDRRYGATDNRRNGASLKR